MADVNECEQKTDACPKMATCHNTVGHYSCSCPPGRKLAKETNSCNPDINLIIGKPLEISILIYSSVGLNSPNCDCSCKI